MGNSYFAFKQFTVQQDKCAMKVCTDACLFGAIAAAHFSDSKQPLQVLDIGTGTGLLSLMFAQKNSGAIIDAVEVDGGAAIQAAENFTASPWKERLSVHHTSIQKFAEANQPVNQSTNHPTKLRYDFIISNPPFFESDLKSNDESRNIALHSSELSLAELLTIAQKLLKPTGIFGVLLPWHRSAYFIDMANSQGFYLLKNISVKQSIMHSFFRSILFFGNAPMAHVEEQVSIKHENNCYTSGFITLLKDYYLYL